MPRPRRSGVPELMALPVANARGVPVRLSEIASVVTEPELPTILHKDLERVVYVFAEMAGRVPAEAIVAVQGDVAQRPPSGIRYAWAGEREWQITLDVFRDLGIAFAAALVMIYVLLLGQLRSYSLPLVVMSSIPPSSPGRWCP
jgi:multidrug efflux pump subunit AcrB